MRQLSCGIDFGTSNSSLALVQDQAVSLVAVEEAHTTIPSAVFFPKGQYTPYFGRAATDRFFTKTEGRYMRSLKRILGTSLARQGTLINSKLHTFDSIIALFLKNLTDKANSLVESNIEQVVMGRPVHFVDNDPQADKRAEQELKAIARSIGFKHIAFQYEPIAAAFAHEQHISGEKLAIVIDLGGGTSDFSVIRLSRKYIDKKDRTADILANTGIRVGGNDFDKNLSLTAFMPQLGFKSTYGEKSLEVPLKLYHDLSEWSKINFLYTIKIASQVRQLLNQSHDKPKLSRLLAILEQETGHSLLARVEDTKIALTSQNDYAALLDFIEEDLYVNINRSLFEQSINDEVEKITRTALECIRKAGVHTQDIELVILTGGSTEIPLIQEAFRKLFNNASVAGENKLASVGLGLGYDSQKKFG